ncbi:MAG: DJ-1/PfpI family protein [Sphingobacteriia bacterium]|nr:DJ-1/PfpI family protein [Sphingobacteriia bacterium]
MNVGFLYFDKFANHEIIMAINKGVYTSTENQKIVVEYGLNEIDPKTIDVLVIPGGFTEEIIKNETLISYIVELDKLQKTIAAICGGTFILASSGILKNKECTGHFIKFDNATPELALF